MKSETVNYLIVGQGIAGSVLALSLLKRGKKILVIDEPSLSSCSKVAAGLYNPIVFKRLSKSWKADELVPAADKFYNEAETLFKKKIHYKKNIVKLFVNEEEKKLWETKKQKAEGKYLSEIFNGSDLPAQVMENKGYAEVTGSGWVDVKIFLDETRNYLSKNNLLKEEIFDHSLIKEGASHREYKSIQAKKIIFCEGYKATENPYFKYLSFKPAKGEVLTIRIKNFTIEKALNKGVFILPVGNNIFRVGATYQWDDLNDITTEKAKEELIEKLKKVIDAPFEIIEHKAGVRPATKDRRPFIGFHPQHSNIGIFNGMGTKAVMLAPYLAGNLIDHIENDIALDTEADIKRVV